MQNRDFVIIGGRQVRHATACRDYVCGICESPLVTKQSLNHEERRLEVRTVCSKDESHSWFISKSSLQLRLHNEAIQADGLERMGKMPLKDRNDEFGQPRRVRVPRLGHIRQGVMVKNDKGKEYPTSTDYFIIDPSDDKERILPEVWAAIAGFYPNQDVEKPTTIPIVFLASLEEIMAPESYKKRAGKSGMVVCAGDGEFIRWKLTNDFKVEISDGERKDGKGQVACPGGRKEGRHPWCEGCAAELELQFAIRGYESTGVWVLRTKSMIFRDQFWLQVGIVRALVEKGIIPSFVGAPFILRRQVETVTAPLKDGKLGAVEMPITSIMVDPAWFREIMSRNRQQLLPAATEPKALSEPKPWYERPEVGPHPWDAETVRQYVINACFEYGQEFDDGDAPVPGKLLEKVLAFLINIYLKSMDRPDASQAATAATTYLFGGPVSSIGQSAALYRWIVGNGKEAHPDFEQEALTVLDAALSVSAEEVTEEQPAEEPPTEESPAGPPPAEPDARWSKMGARRIA